MKYGIILLLSLSLSIKNVEDQKPNILFLFADDLRSDALGIYGNKMIQTPHIDSLAQQGSRFTNTYVMGGHHGAICMASRAMLMSGKQLFNVYDRLNGVNTMMMDFAKAGYTTFGTGKWHNEKEAFEANFQLAKNVFLGGMADHYNVKVRDYKEDGTLGEPEIKGYSSEIFANSAIDFIETQKNSRAPFFCYVAFTAPHDPYSPPTDFIDFYSDSTIAIPENFLPLHPFQFDHLTVRDENLTDWPRNPEVVKKILADYYGIITHLDQQIGRIISILKKSGKYENTIIVFLADNGLAVGSHGLLGKQSLYEHSIKVPFIIKGPGIPENKILDAFSYIHDLYPTLAELTGIKVLGNVDGKSLVPVINGSTTQVRESLFAAYRNTVRSVRKDNLKLIQYPQLNYTQLFDLKTDPFEKNNLADDPNFLDAKEMLMNLLLNNQSIANDTVSLVSEFPQSKEYNYDTLIRKPDQWQPDYILKKYFSGN